MTADELHAQWERVRKEYDKQNGLMRIEIALTPDNVARIMALHETELSRGGVSVEAMVVRFWVEDMVLRVLYGEVKG